MVFHAGQVLDPTAAHQHDGVFLEVVTLAADVADDFKAACEADFGDFTQRGVWFFGRCRIDTSANTASLRAIFQRRGLGLRQNLFALFTNELIYRWHRLFLSFLCFIFL